MKLIPSSWYIVGSPLLYSVWSVWYDMIYCFGKLGPPQWWKLSAMMKRLWMMEMLDWGGMNFWQMMRLMTWILILSLTSSDMYQLKKKWKNCISLPKAAAWAKPSWSQASTGGFGLAQIFAKPEPPQARPSQALHITIVCPRGTGFDLTQTGGQSCYQSFSQCRKAPPLWKRQPYRTWCEHRLE